MPGNAAYDKNPASAQQASSNMNASELPSTSAFNRTINKSSISDWYAMAQMAAQDYFSRLQMSGMVHPDMANFPSLGALNSFHNSSPMPSGSGGNKHNLKRKEKGNQEEFEKLNNPKEVSSKIFNKNPFS